MSLKNKGRVGNWILNLFLCWIMSLCSLICAQSVENKQGVVDTIYSSPRIDTSNGPELFRLGRGAKDTVAFAFLNRDQALDTLIGWLLIKRPAMLLGYLPKDSFVAQWRSHDTATLKQVVEGSWLTYQFKFKKSILKTQLKMKQSKVNFKMVEVVPRPKITVSSAGDGITKYDYTLRYKKLKYILSFQLWWINGKGYWVNEVSWTMGV